MTAPDKKCEELKTCPFCGTTQLMKNNQDDIWHQKSSDCPLSTMPIDVRAWNTRAMGAEGLVPLDEKAVNKIIYGWICSENQEHGAWTPKMIADSASKEICARFGIPSVDVPSVEDIEKILARVEIKLDYSPANGKLIGINFCNKNDIAKAIHALLCKTGEKGGE